MAGKAQRFAKARQDLGPTGGATDTFLPEDHDTYHRKPSRQVKQVPLVAAVVDDPPSALTHGANA